jgi:hypothetical protein
VPNLTTASRFPARAKADSGRYSAKAAKPSIPHRPDAFFTPRFPKESEGRDRAHFFYEADRKTTNTKRFKIKLRGHFHFVVKQRLHERHYGIKRVRAVLIETTDRYWAEQLKAAARDPIVVGPKPSELFWFTHSGVLTKEVEVGGRPRPAFLLKPDIILDRIWTSVFDDRVLSLPD